MTTQNSSTATLPANQRDSEGVTASSATTFMPSILTSPSTSSTPTTVQSAVSQIQIDSLSVTISLCNGTDYAVTMDMFEDGRTITS